MIELLLNPAPGWRVLPQLPWGAGSVPYKFLGNRPPSHLLLLQMYLNSDIFFSVLCFFFGEIC
jgi:hypothetical protein